MRLRRSGAWESLSIDFHPDGDWLVASTRQSSRVTFWPLRRARPTVVSGYAQPWRPLTFSRDGQWLATFWTDGLPRLWPLPGSGPSEVRTLRLPELFTTLGLEFSPDDRFLFRVGDGPPHVVPLDGSPARSLEKPLGRRLNTRVAVSPSGRRLATATFHGEGPEWLAVWDLETGERRRFDLPKATRDEGEEALFSRRSPGLVHSLGFSDETTLYTAGMAGVLRWNLQTGRHELVFPTEPGFFAVMEMDVEGRTGLVSLQDAADPRERCAGFGLLDLGSGMLKPLPAFGECPPCFALDASGTVAVTGGSDGVVRVGRVSGEEPHLLLGHGGVVSRVAVSPDLRWVASAGGDDTLRLWPMPDLSRPPLHTLPHEELLARLRSFTNLRAVRDSTSPTGWTIVLDPFPGWAVQPKW